MAEFVIPAITPITANVGGLRLIDNVLSSIDYSSALGQISAGIKTALNNLEGIEGKITYISGGVDHISGVISGELSNAISVLRVSCDALRYDLDELSGKSIFHYINNVSLLKPIAENPLHLSVTIYRDASMEETNLPLFNSALDICSAYVEALLVNNAYNVLSTDETEIKDGSTIYSDFGTHWMPAPTDGSGVIGFGPEFNNAAVNVKLYDWLKSMASRNANVKEFLENDLTKETKLYLRYEWGYFSGGVLHKSDCYSAVVPSQAEQAATRNTDDSAESSSSTTYSAIISVDYTDNDEWTVDGGKTYTCVAGNLNILKDGVGSSRNQIYLKDYNPGNEYRIKFVARSTITVNADTGLAIIGNGAYVEDFENYGQTFTSGKTYLIAIQGGMIQVLATK